MGNCIRTEMWKAFHNKMMRSALLIGFILVIADLVQTAITVSDLGASYAHSPGGYDGCSLFVNWIGVNGVTVGAVVFYAVWPFLAAMPYGWSLYEDNRSHMTNNILTRVPYSQYLTAKMAAVFVSGGMGDESDVDMTAMALTSLAPYQEETDIKAAVDAPLTYLSDAQQADGGFMSWGAANSESCAQVIVALTALGIDSAADSRFVKNGASPLDGLCAFACEGGGFRHSDEVWLLSRASTHWPPATASGRARHACST